MLPDIWGLAAVAAKCALYIGVLTATGTVMATWVFRLDGYRRMAATFAAIGLTATLTDFAVRGANLSGDASGMVDPELLSLLWSTSVGDALNYRVVGLATLMIGLFAGNRGHWISLLGAVGAVYSFTLVGHISTAGSILLNFSLTLHLLAIALWIGILTPLKHLCSTPGNTAAAAGVAHRFGLIAMVSVPALLMAGGHMGYTLVGSLTALVGSSYGQAIIVKTLLVALLLGFAAANKWRFTPRLRAGESLAAKQLAHSITTEQAIVVAVLAVTALLTSALSLPE